jgi:molybdenum cofactor cytidylyltransferase
LKKLNGESKNIKITGLIVAAGESRRMGTAKQLLPFGHSTILGQVIKNALESNLDEIVVVLGYQAQEISQSISGIPVKVVINPEFRQGLSSSIKKGLSSIAKTSALMIILGDQPLVGKEIINSLIAEFAKGNRGIIVPVYNNTKGNPVIFAPTYRNQLLALQGDVGGKGIVRAHPEDVAELNVDSEAVICDIDERDDYRMHLEKGSL